MKLQIFFVIVLFSLFSIVSLKAEPTPSVEWLMNEPASLFDIGMMQLRDFNKTYWIPKLVEQIKPLGLTLKNLGAGCAVYDFKKNIITIEVSFIGKPTEKICANILRQYKHIVSPLSLEYFSPVASFFSHINYSNAGDPKDIADKLNKITRITVGISESDQLGLL